MEFFLEFFLPLAHPWQNFLEDPYPGMSMSVYLCVYLYGVYILDTHRLAVPAHLVQDSISDPEPLHHHLLHLLLHVLVQLLLLSLSHLSGVCVQPAHTNVPIGNARLLSSEAQHFAWTI